MDFVEADIKPTSGVDRTSLKIGDRVGFTDKSGQECYGEVFKLNSKTAGVMVGGMQWRVAYSLLTSVIDGELGAEAVLIEYEHKH